MPGLLGGRSFDEAAGSAFPKLVEAKRQLRPRQVLARWVRYDLIALDEVSYVPIPDLGAEFLFHMVEERAERAAVLMATNLPFSEWTQVIPTNKWFFVKIRWRCR